jgi:hypothetical protein
MDHQMPAKEHNVLFTDGGAIVLGSVAADGTVNKHAYLVRCAHDDEFQAEYWMEVADFTGDRPSPLSFDQWCQKFLGE